MFDELSGQVFLPEQLTIIQTAYNQACKILVAADEFGSPQTLPRPKASRPQSWKSPLPVKAAPMSLRSGPWSASAFDLLIGGMGHVTDAISRANGP